MNGSITTFSAGNPINLLKSILRADGAEKIKKNAWIVVDREELKVAIRAYLTWLDNFAANKNSKKTVVSEKKPANLMSMNKRRM